MMTYRINATSEIMKQLVTADVDGGRAAEGAGLFEEADKD